MRAHLTVEQRQGHWSPRTALITQRPRSMLPLLSAAPARLADAPRLVVTWWDPRVAPAAARRLRGRQPGPGLRRRLPRRRGA
jgi:hypothetical protein